MSSRPSSYVWELFSKVADKPEVICDICHNKFSYKDGSTSSLKRHAERYHEVEAKKHRLESEAADNSKKTATSSKHHLQQPTISQFVKSKSMLDKHSAKAVSMTDAIIKMVTVDLQPLSIVDDVGFRSFSAASEPRYKLQSRATFRNKLIPEAYHKAASQLKTKLMEQLSQVSLISITTDAWTSRKTASYVTYTIHFINSEFRMESYVLGTLEFREKHTAVNLRSHMVKLLTKWGINGNLQDCHSANDEAEKVDTDAETNVDDDDELEEVCDIGGEDEEQSQVHEDDCPLDENISVYITTDNASNISKAVAESKFEHIRCFAHTINLAVSKGLKVVERPLNILRRIVGLFHRSSTANILLQVRKPTIFY